MFPFYTDDSFWDDMYKEESIQNTLIDPDPHNTDEYRTLFGFLFHDFIGPFFSFANEFFSLRKYPVLNEMYT